MSGSGIDYVSGSPESARITDPDVAKANIIGLLRGILFGLVGEGAETGTGDTTTDTPVTDPSAANVSLETLMRGVLLALLNQQQMDQERQLLMMEKLMTTQTAILMAICRMVNAAVPGAGEGPREYLDNAQDLLN